MIETVKARALRRGDVITWDGQQVVVTSVCDVDNWIEIETDRGDLFYVPWARPFEVDRREWPEYGDREEAREAVGGELW